MIGAEVLQELFFLNNVCWNREYITLRGPVRIGQGGEFDSQMIGERSQKTSSAIRVATLKPSKEIHQRCLDGKEIRKVMCD